MSCKKVISAVIFAPVLFLLLPLLIPAQLIVMIINVCVASRWSIGGALRLVMVIFEHLFFMVRVVPVMAPVLIGYLLNGNALAASACSGGTCYVKKGVPFERQLAKAAVAAAGFGAGNNVKSADERSLGGSSVEESSYSESGATSPMWSPRYPIELQPPKKTYRRVTTRYMKLDVYPAPHSAPGPHPVIVFIYGGGWVDGSRWHYYRLACMLREHCGAVVVVPDYPTYPNGSILEMAESVARCLVWTAANAEMYGGSPDSIWVCGHSAGAHLAAYAILRSIMAKGSGSNALPETLLHKGHSEPPIALTGLGPVHYKGAGPRPGGGEPHPSLPVVDYSRVPRVEGVILFSGVYDLAEHLVFERERGVDRVSGMSAATGGYWDAVSPLQLLRAMAADPALYPLQAEHCPPCGFHLVHARHDHVVTVRQSLAFREALLALEATHRPTSPPRHPDHVPGHHPDAQINFASGVSAVLPPANHSFDSTSNTSSVPGHHSGGGGSGAPVVLCPHGVRDIGLVHSEVVLGPLQVEAADVGTHPTIAAIKGALFGCCIPKETLEF